MKNILTFLWVALTITSSVFAQNNTSNTSESLHYKKQGTIEYQIDGYNKTTQKNLKLLSTVGKESLVVLDENSRKIYQLVNYANINSGDIENVKVLLENTTKDFFIASEKTFHVYLNDQIVSGENLNIDGKDHLHFVNDINKTYYLEGVGNVSGYVANNIYELEAAPDNTYWFRGTDFGSFGIVKKGKMLQQNYTYSEDRGNLIALVDGVETYYLEGYATMASFVFKPVKMYDEVVNGLIDNIIEDIEKENSNKCISGDCNNGWGKTKFENGYYEGFSKNGKREGYGMYLWEGVGKYIGNWEGDIQNGFGLYLPDNGDQYVGEYKNGKMNGRGYTAVGDTWTYGLFTNGELVTEYHFYDNGIEIGCVAGDCKDKYGRYVFESGGSFTGFFKDGHFVAGDYKSSTGDKYTGEFNSDNQFERFGRYFYKSGSYYGGEWKNGERNGKGYYLNENKEEFIGEWLNNEIIKMHN